MLICKNGRLYAGQSSFTLPDGCKINDAPLAAYRNGINLCTDDVCCKRCISSASNTTYSQLICGRMK